MQVPSVLTKKGKLGHRPRHAHGESDGRGREEATLLQVKDSQGHRQPPKARRGAWVRSPIRAPPRNSPADIGAGGCERSGFCTLGQ